MAINFYQTNGSYSEVADPRSNSGGISRDGSGYKMASQPYSFNLEDFKNKNTLTEAAKEIIRRKQNFNKDIADRKKWVRSLGQATGAFGAPTVDEYGKPIVGGITNARFAELSPADQAAVRQSRRGALQAYSRGLQEEEAYRGTRMEDVTNMITKGHQEYREQQADARADRQENRLAEASRMDNLAKMVNLGVGVTFKDIYPNDPYVTSTKKGGSASWRNNNPLNIKWGAFGKSYGGAQKGTLSASPDGSHFTNFVSVQQGLDAGVDLLLGSTYKNLTLNDAMKLWSGDYKGDPNAYGLQELLNKGFKFGDSLYKKDDIMSYANMSYVGIRRDPNTITIKDLNREELTLLVQTMTQLEGWNSNGQMLATNPTDLEGWERNILKNQLVNDDGEFNISAEDFSSLTMEQRLAAEQTIRQQNIDSATSYLNKNKDKNLSGDVMYGALNRLFGSVLDPSGLESAMLGAGYTKSINGEWLATN